MIAIVVGLLEYYDALRRCRIGSLLCGLPDA